LSLSVVANFLKKQQQRFSHNELMSLLEFSPVVVFLKILKAFKAFR
jgi:hypothetical protein